MIQKVAKLLQHLRLKRPSGKWASKLQNVRIRKRRLLHLQHVVCGWTCRNFPWLHTCSSPKAQSQQHNCRQASGRDLLPFHVCSLSSSTACRYCSGVIPTHFLNTRLKFWVELNPTLNPTSLMSRSVDCRSIFALSTRY